MTVNSRNFKLGISDVSGWFLVEIIKPMSTTFRQGMNAWCKYTSNRNDFKLKTLAEDYEQCFGFAYRRHFKKLTTIREFTNVF